MSYILDALKKAESERKLGAVPNIHAQSPAGIAPTQHSPWRKPGIWAGLVALAIAGGGLAWWQTASQQTPPLAEVSTTAQTAVPPPTPPAPQVATAPAIPETPAVKSEAPEPEKPVKRAKPAQAEPRKNAKAAPKQEQRTAKAEKPAPEPTPSSGERIASLRELPDHIQREIPPLVVNGYIYSPNKADRTVLVNGKLLREGDQVAPDFAVERLTQGGMVLNYKGYRYRASY